MKEKQEPRRRNAARAMHVYATMSSVSFEDSIVAPQSAPKVITVTRAHLGDILKTEREPLVPAPYTAERMMHFLGGPLPSNQQKCPPAQSPLAFGPHTESRSSTTESDLNLIPTTYS